MVMPYDQEPSSLRHSLARKGGALIVLTFAATALRSSHIFRRAGRTFCGRGKDQHFEEMGERQGRVNQNRRAQQHGSAASSPR
jgi:hypothetical protein